MNKRKIWIDLTNSPHVLFFKPFINDWKLKGFDVLITTRDLANTIDLIKLEKWDYKIIGGHAGKNSIMKLIFFIIRCFKLVFFLLKEKPNVAVSHSSFYSPISSFFSGVPVLYLNDNEHAVGNIISFLFATKSYVPKFLKNYISSSFFINKKHILFYDGIKEGIYLCNFKQESESAIRDKIYLRLEPNTAQYYNYKSDFLDDFIVKLNRTHDLILIPRNKKQIKYYKKSKFGNLKILYTPLPLSKIYANCKLFIGAGGSMTRELAFLGVPTLSIYQGALLEVDKYLIKNKYMFFSKNPNLQILDKILSKNQLVSNNFLIESGKKSFNEINSSIINLIKK